jgi:hypothetical protein
MNHRLAKVVSLVVCFALFPSGLAKAASTNIDDGFFEDNRFEEGYQGVIFRDQTLWTNTFSWIEIGGRSCEDIAGNCLVYRDGNQRYPTGSFNALLGPCLTDLDTDCIESVEGTDLNQGFESASFSRPFPINGSNDFIGDLAKGLPSGGPAGIWKFPTISHIGGSDFFLRVGVSGRINGDISGLDFIAKESVSINAELYAVDEIDSLPCTEDGIRTFCGPRKSRFTEDTNGGPSVGVLISPWVGSGSGWLGKSDCVMTSTLRCLQRRALPENLTVRITLRLANSPSGWLHGRISDPTMSLNKSSTGNGYKLVVSGSSVSVPAIKSGGNFFSFSSRIQDAYRLNGRYKSNPSFSRNFGCNDGKCLDPATRNSTSKPLPSGKDSIDELVLWLPHVQDTASGDLSTWSIRTIPTSELSGSNLNCFKSDGTLKGLVATNATAYSAGPPQFDQSQGSLNYQVSAPHYTSGGGVFSGTYDLIVRSDVARCVYGFSSAPLNATVSVSEADGMTATATKIVSERDGWIRVAAYGFGFSTPTINVAFDQIKVKRQLQLKKKLVCAKGKRVRMIYGTKPSCPKGYKVKK